MAYNPLLGTPDIRRLNLASDPATQLDLGSRTAGQVSQSAQDMTPYQKFNLAILDMLKQQQQLGTGKFREAELTGMERQSQAGLEPLPADIAGLQLNPAQIAEYRRQRTAPFEPQIQGAQQMGKTFSEQIKGFETVLNYAKEFGKEFAKVSPTPEIVEGYRQSIIAGNNPSIIPEEVRNQVLQKMTTDDWSQWAEANRKGTQDSISAYQQLQLDQNKQNRAQQIAGQFDNEAIVKQYNTVAEAVGYVSSLGDLPTDDIARIYQFAKIMDPASSVREGEYKTVQDYATTLLQKTGLKAKRIFTNSGILTNEARNFLNKTLMGRLEASKKNYDNVYNEYLRRVDYILGKQGEGQNYITNYAGGYASSESGGTVEKNGMQFKINTDGSYTRVK